MNDQAHSLREQVAAMPLESIDVSRPELFQDDTVETYFARLRDEAPVHFCPESRFGPYWSITRYQDIMAVDSNHKVFSSDAYKGGIQIVDMPKGLERPNFINMDPPEHDRKRKVVSPIVAPANLARLQSVIQERVDDILDNIPRGETFNWVDHVSIELTTRMLATLLDFPYEDRHMLKEFSDLAVLDLTAGGEINTEEKRAAAMQPYIDYLKRLFDERSTSEPKPDLLSMLAHSDETRQLSPKEFFATLTLLIVGGNDTTRNSISGGLLALSEHPDEWQKLRDDPGLVTSLVPEIIRWQTPLTHMRRTALSDFTMHDITIPAGSKVIMWYLSGNRDERAIDEPHRFIVDRKRPRQHLSFGFGVHRCVGNRLAEMQLRSLWEGILARGLNIEVVGPAERVYSNFIHGIHALPVRVH